MPLHKDLTGADLHEPKGAAGAAIGTVYVSDGSGSGTWAKPAAADTTIVDSGNLFTATHVEGALSELWTSFGILDRAFDDVSNNSTVLVPIPFSCQVVEILMVLAGGITGADSHITVTRSDGAAMGTQTIAYAGSTEGTSFTFVPSGNDILTYPTHKYIKLVSDGGSTTAQKLYLLVHVKRV